MFPRTGAAPVICPQTLLPRTFLSACDGWVSISSMEGSFLGGCPHWGGASVGLGGAGFLPSSLVPGLPHQPDRGL